MESNIATPQAAPIAPAPQPMAAGGQPPMPVAAPPMQSAPSLEDGGAVVKNSGGGFKEWFSDINIVDVAVSAFIVGGILYMTHYYKFMMMLEKAGYADLNAKISKMQSAMDAQKAEMNATGRLEKSRKRPVMRLG